MNTMVLTIQQLLTLLESKPVITICLSGQKELSNALKEIGISAVLKPFDFNYESWAGGLVAETKLSDEHIDTTMGVHIVKNPKRLRAVARPIEEDEVEVFLAMFLKQHKDRFVLNKNNHFIVFQDTVHTGRSLEIVRKALIMNGIPRKKIVTAAFNSSISPVFPPDVCGGRMILRPPRQKKRRHWIRVNYHGQDFALNVPLP